MITDVPQLAILTKIDKVYGLVEEDISNAYQSEVFQSFISKAADVIGIPGSHVLPVQNYQSETELRADVDKLALVALYQVLISGCGFIQGQYECVLYEPL
jgi:hypothetical protein